MNDQTRLTYPEAIVGRYERLPPNAKACGSSIAHADCRFAGENHECTASALAHSECPYRAAGFRSVFA